MGCTPKDIYNSLIAAGFSTNQAVGAMANGIAESGLRPEARVVDSNGYYSDGIWQFNEASYPNAGSLVTGNCQADIAAQVGLLKRSASGQALAGASGAEVAGNFATYFERCATCQPGGSSYNARVANAATVSGWVSSGKWPTSTAGLTGASGAPAGSGGTGLDCAFGPNLPLVGTVCLLKKATIRHMVGGGLIVGGGLVGGLGVILLAAFAFRASGAARAAGQVAQVYAPAGRAYQRQSARRERERTGRQRAQQAEVRRGSAEARRAAGTPRNQSRAVRGQAPRRPRPAPQPRPPREESHE